MSHDLHALALLLGQAERQRDAALAEHIKAEVARRSAAAQADQLVVYRAEYEQRWKAEFCREGRIELVRCYHGFMERLSQAVEQQAAIAEHAAGQVELAVAAVRGLELRTAGLRKLVERRLREGDTARARVEQRESDDQAARLAWSRLTTPGNPAAV